MAIHLESLELHRARKLRKITCVAVSAFLVTAFFLSLSPAGLFDTFRRARHPLVPAGARPPHGADAPPHQIHVAGAPLVPLAQATSAKPHPNSCTLEVDRLRQVKERYGLGDEVQYLQRRVAFTRQPALARKRMTILPQKLLPAEGWTRIDFTQPRPYTDACSEPLQIQVSASGLPSTVNASDFVFGVSSVYDRVMDSGPMNDWAHWLTDGNGHSNGAKLVLTLLDSGSEAIDEARLAEVSEKLHGLGIDADVLASDPNASMAERYVQLVPTLYATAPRKWVVLCDDDTFFPSMHALIKRLGEFDESREMYIGALSEDSDAIKRYGPQAFGGAGIFLSLPMARRLAPLISDCVATDPNGAGQGDLTLRNCIYHETETRLTALPELWQLDTFGDPAGFYEWGIQPLSLHHYRGWHHTKPGHISKVARVCGEDCILQRFQTSDDFIISGFSIAKYPKGIDFDTNQMEGTMSAEKDKMGWSLMYRFGPMRPSLAKTGRKRAWELQESNVQADGSVLQTYIRKKDDARWKARIDGVIELTFAEAQ